MVPRITWCDVSSAILASERSRRDSAAAERAVVLKRMLIASNGEYIKCTSVRRLLALCGHDTSSQETVVAIQEAFPSVEWVRRPAATVDSARVFMGLSLRPGFTVVGVAGVLKKRWERNLGGLVSAWEKRLEDEGMPENVHRIKDPANPMNAPTNSGHGTTLKDIGAYRNGKDDSNEPRSSDFHDHILECAAQHPGFAAGLARDLSDFRNLANLIPGFFKSQQEKDIWRMYTQQGMLCCDIAKAFDSTSTEIMHRVKCTEKRLRAHMKHGPDPREMPMANMPVAVRYLYANSWRTKLERDIWERNVTTRATNVEIAQEFDIDASEVMKILRRHRLRAGLSIDQVAKLSR